MSYIIRAIVNPTVKYSVLSDERGNYGSKVTAEAVFQKADEANANGHRFPRSILSRAVNEIQKEVESNHFLGELDHPDNINDINRIGTVCLKSVSHVITKLTMDGDYVIGQFKTLDTPNGIILASLLRDSIKIGVSIRAITDQDISYGGEHVDTINDFNFISYDAVHSPAYPDAYIKGIMSSVFRIAENEGIITQQTPNIITPNSQNNILGSINSVSDFKSILSDAITDALKKLHNKK